jgi:DNA-directed RNA polymerase specialized sigma54-like protein
MPPAMDTFVKIVSLPWQGLLERVQQELQENPVLEVSEFRELIEAEEWEADIFFAPNATGDYEVRVADTRLPTLFISERYLELFQDPTGDPRAKNYLERKINRARQLLVALQRRRDLCEKIAASLLHRQRAFVERGPDAIVKLPISTLRDDTGFDVPILALALRNKRIQTSHGIFESEQLVAIQPWSWPSRN